MEIVDPCVPLHLVPPGSRAVVFAADQPQYQPLPSVRTPDGKVITRWSPSEDERAALVRGEDLYLTILSQGPICLVLLTVGVIDWTRPL